MITETMTWLEIKREVVSDLYESDIYPRIGNILESKMKAYDRIAKRSENQVFFKEVSIKSKRLNRFYCLPYSRGKDLYRLEGLGFVLAVFTRRKDGYWCIMLSGDSDNKSNIVAYNAHVFNRHRERYDGQNDNLPDDFIDYALKFLAKNTFSYSRNLPSETYGENSVFAYTDDGVLLGLTIDGISVFKTFISESMLFNDQKELNAELRQVVESYKEADLNRFVEEYGNWRKRR